ncbi:sensor histidine kinase [Kitasatospora purpeofusca]|uniref:sensor histidine kinase n=1 Tax=Kitasatospora purpeofusca TaxID=67352 RepID=UPI00225C13A9|nr:histidine kinase [Kitasatospora purpeofusca]MCX4758452.1 sensor domain-containing protein [Kitasatospora purpeofusca]WSR31097.1 sensor domain-containing protein [Kitasatospora purpeofusca]WSR39132.1 sensor domain-containing protein [Kitasatospora purpeofusca]
MTERRAGTAVRGQAGGGADSTVRALLRCQLLSLCAFAVTALGALVVGALLLLPVGVGRSLLPGAAARLRRLSDRYRSWATRWTGTRISPPDPLPEGEGRQRAGAVLADEGFWQDVRWSWLEPWVGGLLVSVPPTLAGFGLFGALVQPFVWRLLGPDNWYAFVPVDSTPSMLAAAVLGLLFVAGGLRLAPAVLGLHARWTRRALAAPYTTELVRRVEHLTDTRAEALDAQASELRRIERDLHDGAQARLVALGMTLDAATRLLDSDPAAARDLLREVRASSARALQDLRDLVHGIHPPILTDRGLGDAVRSLALDCFLDTHVTVELPGRFPAPVEAAAYFAVAELLANASKHGGGREVTIRLAHADGTLTATVADDGRGGADPGGGSGLRGVARRLSTVDGTLALHSPPGGPTTVTLEIPCASSSPKTSSCSGTG